ncbi:hypothetical protein EIN_330520 [Entamoeba invadens IP1]|uniref:Uncharacterized protein n=1 Tax=Entamoeba invadens IP1 TaxID=370355 RepID=L7FLQ5_ENTIV|nr:hypothetical protein EIN_330520 [Entamoeba invadens IP1]ELP88758.1 hypothetical protein EIN_330520 [Entamoeba invadens IP1]|eukprot:XP_004255529.1 hypothetical protein EIN_330520 [Entamoeba invadens IP1]
MENIEWIYNVNLFTKRVEKNIVNVSLFNVVMDDILSRFIVKLYPQNLSLSIKETLGILDISKTVIGGLEMSYLNNIKGDTIALKLPENIRKMEIRNFMHLKVDILNQTQVKNKALVSRFLLLKNIQKDHEKRKVSKKQLNRKKEKKEKRETYQEKLMKGKEQLDFGEEKKEIDDEDY